MKNKKKLLTSGVALVTAAALTLGGTFAWQSISQTAVNEASDQINPGGRLHDDFDGTNKDVYVENFADDEIFARIRLKEYLEVIMNYGTDAEVVDVVIGSRENEVEVDDVKTFDRVGSVFEFKDRVSEDGTTVSAGTKDGTNPIWQWTVGGSTLYMPTFNVNKDSLVADVNGIYEEGNVGTISNRFDPDDPQYTEYTDWSKYVDGDGTTGKGAKMTGTEIYDADSNDIDEVGTDFDNLQEYIDDKNIVTVENVEHKVSETGTAKLISMADWLTLVKDGYDKDTHGNYWVYDTDGWVYWSAPIAAHSATGLLLDGIELTQVMDDTWYYSIEVEGQFVTANDVGKDEGTGFYSESDGPAPSDNAVKLLETIGVEMSAGGGQTDEDEDAKVDNTAAAPIAAKYAKLLDTITKEQWSTLVTLTDGDDEKLHWNTIYSWGEYNWDGDGAYFAYGRYSADRVDSIMMEYNRENYAGYRPIFQLTDSSQLPEDLKVGDVVTIGTLYMNDIPVKVPQNPTTDGDITAFVKGASMVLKTALKDPDYRLQVYYIGDNTFVADRVMLNYMNHQDIYNAINEGNYSSGASADHKDGDPVIYTLARPEDVKTTVNSDGDNVFYRIADSSEDATYRFGMDAALNSTVTWSIKSTNLMQMGQSIGAVDSSGIQKVGEYAELNTKTGEFTIKAAANELIVDFVIEAKAVKGSAVETSTVEVTHSPKLYVYTFNASAEEDGDKKTTTNYQQLNAGESVQVYLTSSNADLFAEAYYVPKYKLENSGSSDYCGCLTVTNDNTTLATVTHSADGTCNKNGAKVVAYVEGLPWICAENYTVYCYSVA